MIATERDRLFDALERVLGHMRKSHTKLARAALEAVRPTIESAATPHELSTMFHRLEIGIERDDENFGAAAELCVRAISRYRRSDSPIVFSAFVSLIGCYTNARLHHTARAHVDWAANRSWLKPESSWEQWALEHAEFWNYVGLHYAYHPVFTECASPVEFHANPPTHTEALKLAQARIQSWTWQPNWEKNHNEIQLVSRKTLIDVASKANRILSGAASGPVMVSYIKEAATSGDLWRYAVLGRACATVALQRSDAGSALAAIDPLIERYRAVKADSYLGDLYYLRSECLRLMGRGAFALDAYRRHVRLARKDFRIGDHMRVLVRPGERSKSADDFAESSPIRRERPGYLRQAVQYIEEHFDDPNLSVASLAHAVGVSERSLLTAFRLHCSVSPLEAIRERRVAFAKRVLSGPRPPARAEIARLCGFSGPRALSAALRSQGRQAKSVSTGAEHG